MRTGLIIFCYSLAVLSFWLWSVLISAIMMGWLLSLVIFVMELKIINNPSFKTNIQFLHGLNDYFACKKKHGVQYFQHFCKIRTVSLKQMQPEASIKLGSAVITININKFPQLWRLRQTDYPKANTLQSVTYLSNQWNNLFPNHLGYFTACV